MDSSRIESVDFSDELLPTLGRAGRENGPAVAALPNSFYAIPGDRGQSVDAAEEDCGAVGAHAEVRAVNRCDAVIELSVPPP